MALSASDVPAVYSLLANSMSGDHRVRKPAHSLNLREVITAKDLASQLDVRLMTSVYFKNSINRYWRHRRDSSGITNEEKIYLRQNLLLHLREENDQVTLMLAVLISKIARDDYTKELTLKELSTKRLTSDQRNFAEISSHFFDYSWRLWQSDAQTILHSFPTLFQNSTTVEQHRDELHFTCERWLLCSKIIRQLIISGFQSDSKCLQVVQPIKDISAVLLNAIPLFLPYYSSFQKEYPKFWDFVKRA